MRVSIYIRVSTLDQAREGYSLAAQRAVLEHWAADWRHEIVRVYEGAGITRLGEMIPGAHEPIIKARGVGEGAGDTEGQGF